MTRGRIALVAVAAAVVAVAAAVVFVPLNSFRGPLEAVASNALKRQVTIRGPLHLSVFPELGIVLKDVSIANAAGARDPQMITVGRILVGAKLLPLLHGDLQVTRVVLKQPVIHLEIGKNGAGNWQFGKARTGSAANPFAPDTLGFRQARIERGKVTYFDARTGASRTLSAVSLSLAAVPSQARRALNFTGTATYDGVPVNFTGSLADLDAFLDAKPSAGQVRLRSTMVDAELNGRFTAPGAIAGSLKLTAPSLRRLAAWAGEKLPPGNGLGNVSVNAGVAASGGVYTLSRASIALDQMKLTGDLSIDTNSKIPTLKGALAIDHLDARPYLAPGASESIASAAKRPQRNEKLALGGLKGVNADLTLTLGGLLLPDIRVDHAVVAATLRGGVLNARLTRLGAYGGAGSGSLTLDATGPVPSLRGSLDMTGVNVRLFLGEMVGIDRISGAGAVRLDVASRGATEDAIVRGLSGRGSLSIANGAIAGADLGAVARVLQSTVTGQLLKGAIGGNAHTSFSSASASFTIQNGVMRTSNLRVTSSVLAITGSGSANLATHQIDFHLDPRPSGGIPGLNLVDIGIPFYVRGTWDNPSFAPDPAGLAKGLVGAVGNGARGLPSLPGKILNTPGNLVRSLFGN